MARKLRAHCCQTFGSLTYRLVAAAFPSWCSEPGSALLIFIWFVMSPLDPQNESTQPSPLELLSEAFDNEPGGSLSEAPICDEPSDADQETLESWTVLRDTLKNLPAEPVTGLRQSIQDEIQRHTVTVTSTSQQPRKSSRQRLLAVASTVVVLVLFVMTVEVGTDGFRPDQESSVAEIDRSVDRSHLVSDLMGSLSQLAPSVSSSVMADEWEVVVLSVDDASIAKTALESAARRRGIEFETPMEDVVAGDESEFSMSVLVSSDVSEELLSVVTDEGYAAKFDRLPDSLTAADSEELKRRFLESMKSPTQSDEYFGEMYVVYSDDTVGTTEIPGRSLATEQNQLVIASTESENSEVNSSAGSQEQSQAVAANDEHGDLNSTEAPVSSSSKPVLVVFRSRKSAEPEIPDQGMVPPRKDPLQEFS